MKAIRTTAKKRMAGFCRVCPVGNGRACVGEESAGKYIDQIRTELVSAMVLTGCRDLASVGSHILRPVGAAST